MADLKRILLERERLYTNVRVDTTGHTSDLARRACSGNNAGCHRRTANGLCRSPRVDIATDRMVSETVILPGVHTDVLTGVRDISWVGTWDSLRRVLKRVG